jgi:CO/xanthine dehydrogenase FAD-binding subunit
VTPGPAGSATLSTHVLDATSEHPAAVPIAGGTDVMVEINFDTRRPEILLDLNRVSELSSWQRSNGQVPSAPPPAGT